MRSDQSTTFADSSERQVPDRERSWRVRWVLLIPFGALIVVGAAFYLLLGRDPHIVASPLIGKAVPQFDLPPVKGRQLGLSSPNLSRDVSLVNVFASWCVACREEHPLLMKLHQSGTVTLHGLDYKDVPDAAAHWLDTMGDPYARTGADLDGRVAIDWGVYGVPETFIVDRAGRIVYKLTGPLNESVLDRSILPMIDRLRQTSAPAWKR